MCSLPLSMLGPHVGLNRAHCQSLWIHLCVSSVFRRPCFLVSSIPSGSYNLSTSSSPGFPELWWEGFDGDIPFRTECSKVSHCLPNVWLSVSLIVPICCTRKLLWWWMNKALIYEYSRMSLGVFSFIHDRLAKLSHSLRLFREILIKPSLPSFLLLIKPLMLSSSPKPRSPTLSSGIWRSKKLCILLLGLS